MTNIVIKNVTGLVSFSSDVPPCDPESTVTKTFVVPDEEYDGYLILVYT